MKQSALAGIIGLLAPISYGFSPHSNYVRAANSYLRESITADLKQPFSELGSAQKYTAEEQASINFQPLSPDDMQQRRSNISADNLKILAPSQTTVSNTSHAHTADVPNLNILSANAVSELLIIDSAVPDKHLFYASVTKNAEIREINAEEDGLTQLLDILSEFNSLETVHLVSHAEDGVLLLGNTQVTENRLREETHSLKILDDAMKQGGDLLLYGCNLAKSQKGIDLLDLISNQANVDIAASNDFTGNRSSLADWDLEIVKGNIESKVPFTEVALKDFSAVLAITDGTGGTINFDGFPNTGYGTYYRTVSYTPTGSVAFNIISYDGGSAPAKDSILCKTFYSQKACSMDFASYGTDEIRINFTGGGTFEIDSMEINPFNSAIEFTIVGYSGGSAKSGASLTTSLTDNTTWQQVDFDADFAGIDELRITNSSGGGAAVGGAMLDTFVIKNAPADSDSDSTVAASATLTEPTSLNTTIDTEGEEVGLLDFTISDLATSDSSATEVTAINVGVSGTSTDAERALITWTMDGNDFTGESGTYNASTDQIEFALATDISVGSGTSETYTIRGYYNDNTSSADLTDGATFILTVDASNFTVGSGSTFASSQSTDNSGGFSVAIDATTLAFTQEPSTSVTSSSTFSTQPQVSAVDARGNVDTGFTNTITLTDNGSGSLSGTLTDSSLNNGVAEFSGVGYVASSDADANFTMTASATGVTDGTSNTINPDVVADRLAFTQEPAPTSIVSGQSTAFTTVPIVSATDSAGTVDTDFSSAFTLSIVDTGGSSLSGGHTVNSFSSTADPDGGGETDVTETPSSGAVTFSGLTLQYTVSGASDVVDIYATASGLTAASSTAITATVNNAPSITVDANPSFTEDGGAVTIDSTITVSDSDGESDLQDGYLNVAITANNTSNDRLVLDTSGTVGLTGTTVDISSTNVGTLVDTSGTNDDGTVENGDSLRINFNSNITADHAATLAEAIQFNNVADAPNTTSRTVTFTINDGIEDGTVATSTVSVSAVTAASTTAASFDTTSGSNLNPGLTFDSSDESLTIANASHIDASAVANGQGGTDTLIIAASVSADLTTSGFTLSNFENLTLNDDASATMVESVHDSFAGNTITAGAGTETITLGTSDGDDTVTGDADVDAYNLNDAYTFTLGSTNQSVSGNAGNDQTVVVGALVLSGPTIDGGSGGTDELQISDGGSIAGASLGGFETLTLSSSAAVTMTESQHDGFTTIDATGTDQITLSSADGDATVTADADVETYVLGAGISITHGAAAQHITGSSAADTVSTSQTATGTLNGNGDTDTLSLSDGASIAGATVSNFENLTIANDGTVTIAASQLSQFSGTITAASTSPGETINVSGDGDFNTLATADIETYSVGDDTSDTRTITLGTGHTSGAVTADSASDAVTFNIGTQTFSGTLTGNSTDDILQMGNGSSIASATLSNVSNLTVDTGASVTMTEAQHDAFTAGFTASGTETITISAATDGFTGDANIENYTLGAANTITLSSGQSTGTITGSTGNDTIDVAALTLGAATLDAGTGTDTLSMSNGASVASATTSNFENLTLASGATVTLAASQLADFDGTITAAGAEQISISGDGDFSTLNSSAIETYSVGDDSSNTRTITLGANDTATNVDATSTSDVVTFSIPGITYTGTLTANGLNLDGVSLADGADISGATLTNFGDLTLANDASVTVSATQYSLFHGHTITAAGTAETIIISGDGDITVNATVIETYTINDDSSDSRTITMAGSTSSTFTASSTTDAITVDLSTFDFSGSFTADSTVANTLVSDGSNDIASATLSGFTNLTLDGSTSNDLTLTVAQLNAFSGTIDGSTTSSDTLTLTATGTVTGGNLSGIETFATGSGGSITITIPASDVSGKTLTATTSASDSFTVTGSASSQTINGSAGGDNLSGGDGADTINGNAGADTINGGVGADTISPGAGTDSMTGSDGNDIFSGSSSDLNGDTIADLSAGDTVKITGVTSLTTSNVRFSDSNTLQVDTDATDFTSVEVSITLSDGAGGNLNILNVADNGSDTDITFENNNDVPVFGGLDNAPAFTEGGSAQVLDDNVTISDTELDALNSSAGNYSGATLTISRNGGANSDDVFGESGNLSALTASGSLTFNSLVYGTVTTNGSGTLVLTFSDTSNIPTTSVVASILQAITYSNGSDAPDASVVLDWVFNDGTANSTGTNQTTISVTATNDAPVLDSVASPTLTAIDEDVEDSSNTGTDVATMVTDGSITDPDGSAVEAIAVITVDNTNGTWQYSTDNGSNWNDFSGTTGSSVDLSSASRLLDGTLTSTSTHKVRFVPTANYNGTATITYRAWDKTSGTAGATADTSTNGDTTAFSTVSDSASITVNSINDTPSVDTNTGVTVERGSNITIANTALSTSDTEDNAANITYTVTAIPTLGAVQLSNSNLSVNDTFTQDDIDNSRIRYVHAGGVNSSDSFTFTVADNNSAQLTGQTFSISIQDTTAPTISSVSIPNSSHKVGDTVTVTITVSSDSDTYSLGSGTVGGYTLNSLSKTNDTTYTAVFTVSNGGTDVAASSSVPVSVVLTDSSSNSNSAFTTAISQSGDAIYANTPEVTLSTDTSTIAEDGGVATITASLTGSLNNQWPDDVVVSLAYSGTATNTTDYTRSSSSVTITAGTSSNTVTVTSVADSIYDALSNETVIVDFDCIIAGNATQAASQTQTITITDAQSAPSVTLSVDNSTIAEDGGTSTPTVTLSNATFENVTVNLAYSGTATAAASGADYNSSASTSITVTQGATSGNASTIITSVDDSDSESSETIIIDVDSVSGGGASESTEQQVTVSITDDDNSAPSFSGLDGTPTHTEGGSATTLDSDATIVDAESDAENSSNGDYTGASLTIARNGGANTDDTFSVVSGSQMAVSGTDITDSIGDKFASFSSSSGTLTVTFSGDLRLPTTALVNEVLQNITYSNGSDSPASSATLDWTFSDGSLTTTGTNQTVVTITPVNDAPSVGTNTGITTSEGGTEVINNTELNESDPDDSGTGLTYTVTTSPSEGTLQLSSSDLATDGSGTFTQDDIDNGRVQYVHAGGETTSDSFAVSLADGGEDSATAATATVNVTITGLNDGPSVATNETLTVNQGSSGTITNSFLNEGDPDDSGSGLTYTVTSVPSNGTLTNNGTSLSTSGTFTQDDIDNSRVVYTHAGGDNTSDSFNFSLADGGENSASAVTGTFNFSINDNITPTLSSSSPSDDATSVAVDSDIVLTFSENIQLGSSGNITIVNAATGATVETFDAATGDSDNGGTVSASGSDVTINPGANLSAGYSFAVQVDSTAVTDDSSNTNAYAGISDSTTLNFTTQPKVVISASPDTILEPGTETATFTLTLQNEDGTSFSATETVTINVSLSGTATVGSDYTSSDCSTGNCNISVSSGQSTATFTTVAVDDGSGDAGETIVASIDSITTSNATEDGTQSATVTISENTAPTISNLPSALSVTEDSTDNVDLSATVFADGEGNSLTITFAVDSGIISSPLGSSGSVTVSNSGTTSMTLAGTVDNLNSFLDNSNAVAITSDLNSTSDITLTVTANDGTVDGTAASATVSVTADNDNPTLAFGTGVSFDMSDGSGAGTATYTETESSITFTATLDSSTWSAGDRGSAYSTTSDTLEAAAASVDQVTLGFSTAVDVDSLVFLNNVDSATDFVFAVTSGSGTSETINKASFVDGSSNIVDVSDWTSVTEITLTNASTSMQPVFDTINVALPPSDLSVTEDVESSLDLSDATFVDIDSSSLTVTLTISAGTFSTPADGSVIGSGVTETLVDDQTITLVGSPADISTYLDTSTAIQYTSTENANGDNAATLSITANDGDGSGNVSLRTLNIDITAVNDAPTISGSPDTSVNEDTAYSFTPTASDAENDTLTFSVTNLPGWATFSTSTGTLSGTPRNSNVGTTSNIVITVSDGTASTSLTAFSLEVINVNDAPTISSNNIAITVDEDSGPGTTKAAAIDVDDSGLTWSVISQGNLGTASISGFGGSATVTYTPGSNANGSDSFVIGVSDGEASDTATVNVTVNPINDAPVIAGVPASLVEVGTAYNFTPLASDLDGDTLSFSIENMPGWASFNTEDGTLSGSPVSNDAGTTEGIIISVTDGLLSASLSAFDIEVIDLNRNFAPTVVDIATSTDEDVAVNIELLGTDANEDTLTYAIATEPSNGTVSIVDNIATYTPTGNFNGTNSFTYVASDSLLESDAATVTINIAAVNDAPSIEGTPSTQTAIDSLYSFTPTATDIDSEELTFSIQNQPDWAAFDSATGELNGTPTEADIGDYLDIIISVSDGELTGTLNAFSIAVVDPNANTAPVATNIETETAEDTVITVTLTATDADEDLLTYSIVTEPLFGTFELVDDQLTYKPSENLFDETEVLEFTATDGVDTSNTATLSILITPVNDAPVIAGEAPVSVRVGQDYSFIPTASDIEQDTLTFTIANQPRWASFNGDTGELSGTPGTSDVGTYGNVTITVSDGVDEAVLDAFNIEVLANEAPVISGSSVTAVEVGNAYQFVPQASDADGDTLTFSIENQPGWTAFDASTGTLSGTPTTDDIGSYTGIVISVSDGLDSTSLPAFDVEVCDVCGNVAPTISGTPSVSITEGSFYSFLPTADDSNGDALTFSISNQPSWTDFDTATGALTGTPGAADIGSTVGIVISVSDGEFTASLSAFTITVEELNDAPTISGTPATSVFRDVEYVFRPTASDPEGATLTFSIENQPSWAAFNRRTGSLRGTPDITEVGDYANIIISVSDGVNKTSLAAFNIEVLFSNSIPRISGTPKTGVLQGRQYSFTPTASDADGDTLSFSASGLPGWLALNEETGNLSGSPQEADIGNTGEIVLSVSDGIDSASLSAFSITVTSANTTPTVADMSVSVAEDNTLSIAANASDADGDDLTLTLVSSTSNGTLVENATGWQYTPASNFVGTDTFVYSASDGEATSGNATVTIEITSVNDLPDAVNDVISLNQNGTGIYTLDVVANDTDVDIATAGDSLTIQGADANFGAVNIVNNQLEFNAGASFIGNVSLVYAIRDNAGRSDQARVRLTVNGVAGVGVPIVTVPDDIIVDATGLFTPVDLGVASATDADGNPLPVSIVSGTTTFAPGEHTVFWQAEDSFGTVTTESQNVKVNPLISLSKDQVVSEGSVVSVEVILNGDAPDYPLTVDYTVAGSATGDGIDHDAQSGSVTFTEGREQLISFEVFTDSEIESQEDVVFTLSSGQNVGANNVSTISISEANIAPEISLTVRQGGDDRLTVAQDEGNVRITGTVTDANPQDSLLVEWSSSGLTDLSNSDNNFIFRPSDFATGIYQVTLFASDDGDPILANTADVYIEIVETLEALSSTTDSDGDLIPDDQEGYADSDGDGIPDYLDSIDDCNVVPEQASTQDEFLVESEPGVCLRQGTVSAVNTSDGIEVIAAAGTGGRQARNSEGELINLVAESLPEDTEAANIGGIFDFILYDLPEEGQVGSIVLPQRAPIPANAVYRKYKANQETWVDFIIDDNNQVFSAEGERGICPPPGSELWVPGLTEGHWCVQLQILDGGSNDDDGEANGAIVDPGGVAVVLDNNSLPRAIDDAVTMQWNTNVEINVLANDSDVDGDTLRVRNIIGDFGTTEIQSDNTVLYTPDPGFVGTDVLVYAISDGNGGTASASVTVTIKGNRAPAAIADSASTDDKTAIEINVLANDRDIDGDDLNIVSAEAEEGDVVITDNNTLLYTPAIGFDGLDTITYVIADTFGRTARSTVSVVVEGNQAPQALNDTATTAFNTAVTVNVLSNDMDVNGDNLTVIDATASSGTVLINDDSSLTFTPDSGFSGNVTIDYTISDGQLEASAVLTVTVQPQPVEVVTVTNKSSGGGGSLAYMIGFLMLALIWRYMEKRNMEKPNLRVRQRG